MGPKVVNIQERLCSVQNNYWLLYTLGEGADLFCSHTSLVPERRVSRLLLRPPNRGAGSDK
jgi:hypothetical protein